MTDGIAIVGMAGRFPGAGSVDELWANLLAGRHSITELTDEQIRTSGLDPARTRVPGYVRMGALLDDVDKADATLFGFTEREAQLRDPQQRVFLEVAHTALEHAGHDPATSPLRVGVYAGGMFNRYAELHVRRNAAALRSYGALNIQTSNDTDYIATLVAFKLGLTGPALSVATACSTSLVAIHLAAQAIRYGECDLAIAGGVEVEFPYAAGHHYVEGGVYSPDGLTRSYDAGGAGTLFANGAGAVVLKALPLALRDGDRILAVLRGSAIGNDGSQKAGFTAPRAEGQAAVVAEALAAAGLDAGTIGYVEGHGTATALGDPIEVQALTGAFRAHTDRRGYCLLGSVKSNIGHLGTAAGVAGLIKAVLAVGHGRIPATVHFQAPNPRMNLERTPFTVVGEPVDWPAGATPRRAGVSSFGMGGTNAHVLIEQAPQRPVPPAATGPVLLTLSAASSAALAELAGRLARGLSGDLGAVAHTLATGRRALPHRATVIAADPGEAAARLSEISGSDPVRAATPVAFVYPGQGSQHAGMAAGLYAALPTFRAELDRCLDLLADDLPVDLRALLVHAQPGDAAAEAALTRTEASQPALFAYEWALTRLLDSWGVRPSALLGHSIGELVAATVAGVFELPDALRLVAARGRLMQTSPPGAMLAVALPPEELDRWLDRCELAAVNGERACVLAGELDVIDAVAGELTAAGHRNTRLRTSHAFHSRLVAPAADGLAEVIAGLPRRAPRMRWVSNVTGTLITAEQATDPRYWAEQLRGTVRFHAGARALTAESSPVLLEVGPGQAMTAQLRRDGQVRARAITVLPCAGRPGDDPLATLLSTVGALWSAGVEVDRGAVSAETAGPRRITTLPGYPYQRRRYWIDPDPDRPAAPVEAAPDDRLTLPGWRQLPPLPGPAGAGDRTWLVFEPPDGPTGAALRAAGATVRVVTAEAATLDLDALRRLIATTPGAGPLEIVHAWTARPRPDGPHSDGPHSDGTDDLAAAGHWHRVGFLPALRLVQAATRECAGRQVRLTALTRGAWEVAGGEALEPGQAAVAGMLAAAARESATLRTRVIDLDPATAPLAELVAPDGPAQVALRSGRRWVREYLPVQEPSGERLGDLVRPLGVYVVTGGLGALGLVAARELAGAAPVRLALLGRRGLPDRDSWAGLCADPGADPRLVATLRAVLDLEAAGSTVLVLPADVTDRASLATALATVRAQFGEINGVVHSAGVAGGGLAAVKDPAVAEAVLAPKITGTLLLDELCGEVDFLMLFSSIAAITADLGLSDYAGANAFLDTFAHQRSRRARTLSVNWPAWAEVGMAVDNAYTGPNSLAQAPVHPLLHRKLAGTTTFESTVDESCWVLGEHRIGTVPVLPGTAFLELALAALEAVDPDALAGPVELADVTFAAPLAVPGRRRVRLALTPAEPGWRFEIRTEDGPAPVVHARGRVGRCTDPPAPPLDLAALRARCVPAEPPRYNDESTLVTVGPRWRALAGVADGDHERLADLVLPEEFGADVDGYRLHPATLDNATGFATGAPVLALPFGYRRVVVHGRLPARYHSVLTAGAGDDGTKTVVRDIRLVDPDGRSLVEITGFTLRAADREQVGRGLAAPTVPGLSTADGARLFRALLGTDLGPQVVVRADGSAPAEEPAAAAEPKPAAAPPSPAPSGASATEGLLIRLWQEVLGGEVSRDDDFFDLGGDSLVAVQLTFRIEVETAVSLPMTALFDTPTVAGLAELLDQRLASR